MRTLLWLCVALLAVGASAQDAADPLRAAIMAKSREQLEEICVKASIPWTRGGDLDELRALVYEFAQREKPGTPKPWKAGAAASGAKKTPEQQQSELMFQAMDTDKNGATHAHHAYLQPANHIGTLPNARQCTRRSTLTAAVDAAQVSSHWRR